jgi:hypothetical protein
LVAGVVVVDGRSSDVERYSLSSAGQRIALVGAGLAFVLLGVLSGAKATLGWRGLDLAIGLVGLMLVIRGWRLGVQATRQGVVDRSLAHDRHYTWCEVEAITLVPGQGPAPAVVQLQLIRKDGGKVVLAGTSAYAITDAGREQAMRAVNELERLRELHRSEHPDC